MTDGEHHGYVNDATNERLERQVIADFRANSGKVGGTVGDFPITIITTTGRKSGQPRVDAARCTLPDDGRVVIFASKGGAPTHPDWYHNIVANPEVIVEVGAEKYTARAEIITGTPRDELFARQVAAAPQFGEYQENTDRVIPVVVLHRTEER